MLVVRLDCDRCELAGGARCTGGRFGGPVPREAAARPEDRCATAGRRRDSRRDWEELSSPPPRARIPRPETEACRQIGRSVDDR